MDKSEKISVKSVGSSNGGARPGAGRKKGVPNIRTKATQAAAENSGITPLDYMLLVLRTSEDPKERMVAANAAAPYVHAKLTSVEVSGDSEKPIHLVIAPNLDKIREVVGRVVAD